MRLIDADALKADYGMKDDCADCEKELQGKVRSCEYDYIYSKMDFCGWIDDAPTIDAVEVVRCKDCIYFDKYTDCIEKYQWDGFCADWARTTYENWYCSRAVRRSDETD